MCFYIQAEYYNELSNVGDVNNIKPYVLKMYFAMNTFRKTHAAEYRNVKYRIVDDDSFTASFDGQTQLKQ